MGKSQAAYYRKASKARAAARVCSPESGHCRVACAVLGVPVLERHSIVACIEKERGKGGKGPPDGAPWPMAKGTESVWFQGRFGACGLRIISYPKGCQ